MRTFDKQSGGSLAMKESRLETPSTIGYRFGMSSQGVIGRRLSSVFGVDREIPREMHRAIDSISDRLCSRR